MQWWHMQFFITFSFSGNTFTCNLQISCLTLFIVISNCNPLPNSLIRMGSSFVFRIGEDYGIPKNIRFECDVSAICGSFSIDSRVALSLTRDPTMIFFVIPNLKGSSRRFDDSRKSNLQWIEPRCYHFGTTGDTRKIAVCSRTPHQMFHTITAKLYAMM